jgi:hypothetical protein
MPRSQLAVCLFGSGFELYSLCGCLQMGKEVIHRMPGDHATLSSYCGAGDMILYIYIYTVYLVSVK